MKTPIIAKSAGLAAGLLLLAACATTTQVLNEWRNADGAGTRFGHFVVVALCKQDQTRRMFEDEFAWQISNQGQMVTRSYNLVLGLNENTASQIPTIARAVGADGVLVIRLLKRKQDARIAAGNLPPVPINLPEFLQYAWQDNYDPPGVPTNAVMIVESSLFNAKSGKLFWTLAMEVNNQLGLKWEINLLAKRVLGKLKDALRTK